MCMAHGVGDGEFKDGRWRAMRAVPHVPAMEALPRLAAAT